MKKISVVLLVLLAVVLAFSGCGGEKASKSIDEIYSGIESEFALPDMLEMSDADLLDYWGIDASVYEEHVFMYADGLSADHIFIVKCLDAQGVAQTEAFFNNYLSFVEVSLANYNPEEADKIDAAVIETKGNYVYFVMCDDVTAVCSAIDAAI